MCRLCGIESPQLPIAFPSPNGTAKSSTNEGRCYHRPNRMSPESTFPEWWNWELSFTAHAELRMEQRGVTEVDVRAMLERATHYEPSVVEGRFMIHTLHKGRPWVVIVEPDVDATLLVVVTPYEVST